MFALNHSIEGRSPATHFALMGALRVVVIKPLVKISLQLLDGFVEVFAERDLIKFLQYGLVEPLANAVGLWVFDLGLCVVNVVDGQEQLIVVLVGSAAEFRSPVGQDAQHRKFIFFVEWQHLIIEKVGRGDRSLGCVELGMGNLAIGIDIGLLVNSPHAFQRTDIEGVLTARIARMGAVRLMRTSL